MQTPTKFPTRFPSKQPTKSPVKAPTSSPTNQPTQVPTFAPVKPPTRLPTKSPTKAPVSAPVAFTPPTSPAVCKSPLATFTDGTLKKCWPSLAGQWYNAGTVCAELLNGLSDQVKITYDTTGSDYCLTEVQAYFGDRIPSNRAGNPQIGWFPAKNTTMPAGCVKTATVVTSLNPRCCSSSAATLWMNRPFRLAAHSSVVLSSGGGGQTAWTTGVDITAGGSWATYTPVNIDCGCNSYPAPVISPTKVLYPTWMLWSPNVDCLDCMAHQNHLQYF